MTDILSPKDREALRLCLEKGQQQSRMPRPSRTAKTNSQLVSIDEPFCVEVQHSSVRPRLLLLSMAEQTAPSLHHINISTAR